jgi:hypothetical protein
MRFGLKSAAALALAVVVNPQAQPDRLTTLTVAQRKLSVIKEEVDGAFTPRSVTPSKATAASYVVSDASHGTLAAAPATTTDHQLQLKEFQTTFSTLVEKTIQANDGQDKMTATPPHQPLDNQTVYAIYHPPLKLYKDIDDLSVRTLAIVGSLQKSASDALPNLPAQRKELEDVRSNLKEALKEYHINLGARALYHQDEVNYFEERLEKESKELRAYYKATAPRSSQQSQPSASAAYKISPNP